MSFFKRGGSGSADGAPAVAPDDVVAARGRARRRLIGAAVLLAAGVIGFPLLFETQPRPVAVDIPILIPDRDRSPPLVLSQAPAATTRADAPPPGDAPAEVRERAGEQGREVPPPADTTAPVKPEPAPAEPARPEPSKPEPAAKLPPAAVAPVSPAAKTPATPAAEPPAASKSAAKAEAARAQALLNGQPVAQAGEARVVVQVGAFAETDAVRQTRAKLDKLGLKSYTQVVEVAGAKRTRVRVGPFSNRAEADKAAARIKAAGLPAAILSL